MDSKRCVLVILVLAGLVGLWWLEPGRARFEYRTGDFWAEQLGHVRSEVRVSAAKRLVRGGPRAVPVLAEVLASDVALARVGAAEILGVLGPWARDAAPALVRATGHSDTGLRRAALGALTRIGSHDPEVVTGLTRLLSDPGAEIRMGAVVALQRCGPAAATAVPELRRLAADDAEPGRLRLLVVQTLAGLGPAAGTAAPELRALLASPAELLRLHGAAALERVTSGDREARRVLLEALGQPRDAAAMAALLLSGLGDRARVAIPRIERLLEVAPRERRAVFAFALARLGDEPERRIDTLIELLDADELPVAGGAAGFLGALGPAARKAVPALERLVDHPQLGPSARQALQRIRARSVAPVPGLGFPAGS